MQLNAITGHIITSSMSVHTALGPGLLESAYECCLADELRLRGLRAQQQVPVPLTYKGRTLSVAYRIDLLVNDSVVVEIKCVAHLLPIHDAQMLSYLKLGGYKVGLLINFHERHLKDGIRRLVSNFDHEPFEPPRRAEAR
jgi:GxxExxY protein